MHWVPKFGRVRVNRSVNLMTICGALIRDGIYGASLERDEVPSLFPGHRHLGLSQPVDVATGLPDHPLDPPLFPVRSLADVVRLVLKNTIRVVLLYHTAIRLEPVKITLDGTAFTGWKIACDASAKNLTFHGERSIRLTSGTCNAIWSRLIGGKLKPCSGTGVLGSYYKALSVCDEAQEILLFL